MKLKTKWLQQCLLKPLCRRSEPSPKEKPFIVGAFYATWMFYPNYRSQPNLLPAPNYAPWHADFNRRGRAQHDHRGKIKNRPGGVYSRPSDSSFSLPRGGQGHSQFYSIDFHVTTQPSLVLSWAPRKYRNLPVSSSPLTASPQRCRPCGCSWRGRCRAR